MIDGTFLLLSKKKGIFLLKKLKSTPFVLLKGEYREKKGSADSACKALPYSQFFLLNHQREARVQSTQAIRAIGKPIFHCSMPLMRFMPNMEVMKVGKRIIMLSDVSSRITVFMLLLIMLA